MTTDYSTAYPDCNLAVYYVEEIVTKGLPPNWRDKYPSPEDFLWIVCRSADLSIEKVGRKGAAEAVGALRAIRRQMDHPSFLAYINGFLGTV